MKRYELPQRELADMRDASRDSIKYLDNSYRDLVEARHIFRDDDEREDRGDMLIGSHHA